MFKTSRVRAENLEVDDRFKMGGNMYRINQTRPHRMNGIMVQLYPIDKPAKTTVVLVVSRSTKFKIYNQ